MTVALSIIVAFVLSFSLNADARPVQAQAKNWTEYFNSPEFKAKRAEAYQQMFGSYPKGWTAENNKKNRKKIQLVGDGTHQFSRPEYLQMVAEAAAKYEEAKERSGPGLGAGTLRSENKGLHSGNPGLPVQRVRRGTIGEGEEESGEGAGVCEKNTGRPEIAGNGRGSQLIHQGEQPCGTENS